MIDYIGRAVPALDEAHVYEPAATQPTAGYFERHSAGYTRSQYSPEQECRFPKNPSNQDLQALGFPDHTFDLVVSQDVFEHIAAPRKAFAEVARVLKPGGAHIFTIPWYPDRLTEARARLVDGEVVNLHSPEYHSDPANLHGALVFTRFGSDIEDMIHDSSGMTTSVIEAHDPGKGNRGDSLYLFHSKTPGGAHS